MYVTRAQTRTHTQIPCSSSTRSTRGTNCTVQASSTSIASRSHSPRVSNDTCQSLKIQLFPENAMTKDYLTFDN